MTEGIPPIPTMYLQPCAVVLKAAAKAYASTDPAPRKIMSIEIIRPLNLAGEISAMYNGTI